MCYRGKHAVLPPIRRQANKSSRTWCRGFARPLRHRSPGSLPICCHLRRTYWNTSRRCKLMVLILGKMVVGFLLRKNHKKICFKMSLFSAVNCARISTFKYFCFRSKDNRTLTVTRLWLLRQSRQEFRYKDNDKFFLGAKNYWSTF